MKRNSYPVVDGYIQYPPEEVARLKAAREEACASAREQLKSCLRAGDVFDPTVDYMSLPGGYYLPVGPLVSN